MVRCGNCGTEYEDDLNYCPNCGQKNSRVKVQEQNEQVFAVGVDTDDDLVITYFPCEDKDITLRDFVTIAGYSKSFQVLDTKEVPKETVEYYIQKAQVAKKVTNASSTSKKEPEKKKDNNAIDNIYKKTLIFTGGTYDAIYHKDDYKEMRYYKSEQRLKAWGTFCRVFEVLGLMAIAVFAGFIMSDVIFKAMDGDTWPAILQYLLLCIGLYAFFLCGRLLCQEQAKIDKLEFVMYDVNKKGGRIESYNKKKLILVYVLNNKRHTISANMPKKKIKSILFKKKSA